jgi:hypothetical protein
VFDEAPLELKRARRCRALPICKRALIGRRLIELPDKTMSRFA